MSLHLMHLRSLNLWGWVQPYAGKGGCAYETVKDGTCWVVRACNVLGEVGDTQGWGIGGITQNNGGNVLQSEMLEGD